MMSFVVACRPHQRGSKKEDLSLNLDRINQGMRHFSRFSGPAIPLPHRAWDFPGDRVDSANLYKVLTQEVIPLFYQRDAQGIPRQWIQRIRRAMVTLVPQFTTMRMVREYTENYYLK